ncbi:MAG: tail fiber domain-containing protein [Rhodospirillales bacterium]|nr:tail fiber domain-containing protein [Rhodospirillales bacterium]
MRRILLSGALFLALTAHSQQAKADCASPAAPAGRIEYFSASEQVFKYCDGTSWIGWGEGGTSNPAGADREIQFNSSGSLAASSQLFFDESNNQFVYSNTANATATSMILSGGNGGVPGSAALRLYSRNDGFPEGFKMEYRGSSGNNIFSLRGVSITDSTANIVINRQGSYGMALGHIPNIYDPDVKNADVAVWAEGNTDATEAFTVQDSGANHLFTVKAGGSIGVGVDTPTTLLDVAGAVKVDYDAATCDGTIAGAIRYDSGNTQFDLCDGLSWKTIATSAGGSKWVTGAGNDIYYNSGSDPMVGIGLTDPTASLHVVGADGNATTPNASEVTRIIGGAGYAASNGTGSNVYMSAGDGGGTGSGGSMTIRAGRPMASGARGGNITIQAGENETLGGTQGGNLTMAAGDAASTPTGTTTIYGGGNTVGGGYSASATRSYLTLSGSGSVTSGQVTLSAGGTHGGVGTPGSMTIKTNNGGFNTSPGGSISITTGNGGATSGTGGALTLTAGNSGSSATGASITLNPGSGSSGNANGYVLLGPTRGNTGIGDATPDSWLEVSLSGSTSQPAFMISSDDANDGDLFYVSSNGYVGIGDTAPSAALDVVGDINYTGVIVDVSDRRLKDNIALLSPQLAKIMALEPVSFTMKDDPDARTEFGFIAQDVREIYPELVKVENDEQKTQSLNYVGMIAPLVAAIKEQQAEIEALRAEIEALKAAQP